MKNRKQLTTRQLCTHRVLPIIASGAIANPRLVEGRFVPVLIVDTSNHTAIKDLVCMHEFSQSGDVKSFWGSLEKDESTICLFLEFKKPVETKASLKFNIVQSGATVALIVATKVLFLRPGKEGDNLINTHSNPSITIEIPDTGFGEIWKTKWKKAIIKDLRSKGLSRKQAKVTGQQIIDEWRDNMCISMKERAFVQRIFHEI